MAQLRAFTALAETRSMSLAGDLLNVSHAAISQQVRALEGHLNLKLVTKDGRGVALTPDGARLGQTLREAFGTIAAEIGDMTGADALRPLQITTTPSFAAGWLMPRIAEFQLRHPNSELMVNPTSSLVEVTPGGVDLAIRYGNGDWPGYGVELLLPSDFQIMGARRLIGDRQISSPQDLLDFHWLQELGTNEVDTWLHDHGVTEARTRGITHLPGNLLLDGLRAGQGIAATARSFVEADIARGDLVVLYEDMNIGWGYFMVTRSGPMRPPLREFVRWLRSQVQRDKDIAGT